MTATQATIAYGLQLKFSGTTIPEGTSVDGPATERDMIEVTNFQSPQAFKEYLAGLLDGGEASVDVNLLPQNTTHKAILTALVTTPQPPTAMSLVLTDSGASVMSWNALVKGFAPKGEVGGKLAATFKFKVTGPITFPA
jgi:hypothetical protein